MQGDYSISFDAAGFSLDYISHNCVSKHGSKFLDTDFDDDLPSPYTQEGRKGIELYPLEHQFIKNTKANLFHPIGGI
ncbi:hypothetical protein [Salipiger thiooxidans]|uniref:hypothetical protein n=1 Tax=Salipiger thiooxidans TaxID=282683 RepID=UPI001CD29055|nr:hypothetical protein [Salipiger thiooxidans]MCA0848106.1 hypothetical protein [Salipiger thiooxidans]